MINEAYLVEHYFWVGSLICTECPIHISTLNNPTRDDISYNCRLWFTSENTRGLNRISRQLENLLFESFSVSDRNVTRVRRFIRLNWRQPHSHIVQNRAAKHVNAYANTKQGVNPAEFQAYTYKTTGWQELIYSLICEWEGRVPYIHERRSNVRGLRNHIPFSRPIWQSSEMVKQLFYV